MSKYITSYSDDHYSVFELSYNNRIFNKNERLIQIYDNQLIKCRVDYFLDSYTKEHLIRVLDFDSI